jgi:hypothetical protein
MSLDNLWSTLLARPTAKGCVRPDSGTG